MTADGEWLRIESLDLEAQGVAHDAEGKVVFVEDVLPGERVQVAVRRRKPSYELASPVAWQRESADRVRPRCPHFGVCGGCAMQHLHPAGQVAVKQRALEDALGHIGKVAPERVLRPLTGPAWGYRHRARLSVRHVVKKGRVLVGFHERRSSYVADIRSCVVLPPHVSALIEPLAALIGGLEARDRLPQIELAVGDATTVLVLRNLVPVGERDRAALRAFAAEHGIVWWLQPKGPDTAAPLDSNADPEADAPPLAYALPAFGVDYPFRPTDFTQVNHALNRALVAQAVALLAPRAGERVVDWFCGLGNFTLPIARSGARVHGLEGSPVLVARAEEAARRNGLAATTTFAARDLFTVEPADLAALGRADRWLIDPPREGAFALAKALADEALDPALKPARIVYVSCNPATLARDAGLLVHRAGYRLEAAGVVDMFPQTAHVESMAVFALDGARADAAPA